MTRSTSLIVSQSRININERSAGGRTRGDRRESLPFVFPSTLALPSVTWAIQIETTKVESASPSPHPVPTPWSLKLNKQIFKARHELGTREASCVLSLRLLFNGVYNQLLDFHNLLRFLCPSPVSRSHFQYE